MALKVTERHKEKMERKKDERGHWRNREFPGNRAKTDFRYFLILYWRFLGLPDPTPLQLDIAYYIQHHKWSGEVDQLIILAFRGAAKSYITAAYVMWQVWRNPDLKVGVLSGSLDRAKNFVTQVLRVLQEWPMMQHLAPGPKDRQSTTSFDVAGVRPDQTPSVWAAGITSQIVGYRADIIVGDDIETPQNSATPALREKLLDGTREFLAIAKPGAQVILLGTPQSQASVYNVLRKEMGYKKVIWPVRYPNKKQRTRYGENLAPYIRKRIEERPELVGTSTEPNRFGEADLAQRMTTWGKSGFALQYMLDTSLSDEDKYPLKLSDLMVLPLDRRTGPMSVSWGADEGLRLRDISPICRAEDGLYAPASVSEQYSRWEDMFAFIDPSGSGKDETTLTIGTELYGTAYVLKQVGWRDGYGDKTLKEIAKLLAEYEVNLCHIEENFGQGMFVKLLLPEVKKAWAARKGPDSGFTSLEPVSSGRTNKEKRIIDTLGVVFRMHRLVINKQVLEEDLLAVQTRMDTDGAGMGIIKSLMHQITNIQEEKDCLAHDDRVEGLSGLVSMFVDRLGVVPEEATEEALEAIREAQAKELGVEIGNMRGEQVVDEAGLRGMLRGND
jgi:hypothetical protein